MEVRILKNSETAFKEWVLEGYRVVLEIEGIEFNKKDEIFLRNKINKITSQDYSEGDIIICVKDRKILGYLWFNEQKIVPVGGMNYGFKDKNYIWVHSVYTSQDTKRKGVASLLYTELENICKIRDIEKLYLEICPKNPISEAFHSKQGFIRETVIYSKKI